MEKPRKQPHAHLFTVRVWLEDLGGGQCEWRGSVKHVTSGEERAFRQWGALAQTLQGLLPVVESDQSVKDTIHRATVTDRMMSEAEAGDA